jgi:hypothetical protein
MPGRTLETDYLVVGCGAAGMAFTDALVTHSDADVIMVDRRHAPGGHWLDAYPFVRLHQPSAYYGVNSLPLGSEAIDRHGPNQGLYERACGPEICAYYDRVMEQRLLPTGRVRHFPMCEYLGQHRFVSRVSSEEYEVKVRRRRVDATYLEPSVPQTSAPPFQVDGSVRCVPIGELSRAAGADGYVIIGAGKTAVDACLWLLDLGVAPEEIRWIRPREAWMMNRAFVQGGELLGTLLEGLSLQLEAAARATSLDDLFQRLNVAEQMLRVDGSLTPTMYRGATVSAGELEQLRRITGVVRLGRVHRIERDAIVLDGGSIPTSPRQLHVHCAASGLNPAPAIPIFTDEVVTPQPIRTGLIPFNAALVGFVEATHREVAEQNRLCPPNRLPEVPLDWVRGALIGMRAEALWARDPALRDWLDGARLNVSRGLRQLRDEPRLQEAWRRYMEYVGPALERLERMLAEGAAAPDIRRARSS